MTAPQEPSYRYETAPPEELTYEQYLALVAAVAASAVASVWTIALPYLGPRLARRDLLGFLAAIYPIVDEARRRVADLARRFYDSERNKHVDPIELPLYEFDFPDLDGVEIRDFFDDITVRAYERFDIDLPPYTPEWFEDSMNEIVHDFIRPDRDAKDLTKVLGLVQREIEDATRRPTLYAVKDDPEAIGWARVEGNENIGSCAFCAMLISRGPVYSSAEAAGAFGGSMIEWHPNCDCKVVPVFKRGKKDWPGYEQFKKLEKLWAQVTKDYLGGKGGGDKLNAFRRYLKDEPFFSDAARRAA